MACYEFSIRQEWSIVIINIIIIVLVVVGASDWGEDPSVSGRNGVAGKYQNSACSSLGAIK